MTRFATTLLLLASVLSGCGSSWDVYVFPATDGPAMLDQCSRSTPTVDSYWHAGYRDVEQAEAALKQAPLLSELYKRQYVGVVIDDSRLLYLNAFRKGFDPDGDVSVAVPVVICDGGDSFWGALFDLERNEFLDVQYNGIT